MSLEFIKPQLATAVDHPPPRAGWIHEVKHDGRSPCAACFERVPKFARLRRYDAY
jgi:hypothetical protein